MKLETDFKPLVLNVLDELMKVYWGPMHRYVGSHPELVQTFSGFLLNPDEIVLYFGTTHMAIEYLGPERVGSVRDNGELQVRYFDFTQKDGNLIEQIVGFNFDDSTVGIGLPLTGVNEDLVIPTNRGFDKLIELNWNFSAQSMVMGMNTGAPELQANIGARIVNGFFFDADDSGLKTRHIKWMDFVPLNFDSSNPEYDTVQISVQRYGDLVERDAEYVYPVPEDFKYEKLPRINRFVELIGSRDTSETDITSFLSEPENSFIITMHFGAVNLKAEIECDWQSEERKPIRPDFFVVGPNGYANIVEFKLPTFKTNSLVGSGNRETLSAEINSYISQTRVYESYFDDPRNREWVKRKYGLKVHRPRRILVMGRRSDFSGEEWRNIQADYRNLEIITYDDLVDGVVAQFYR